jgi:mono/diheme cytochrome c family protein
MRRVLKWIGIIVGVLLIVIIIAAIVLYFIGRNNLNKTYKNIQVESVAIPTSDDALARGQHIVEAISICTNCHGDDLGGKGFSEPGIIVSGNAPNLTAGAGGIGAGFADEDWVRAIRHGVKPNGDAIRAMASNDYYVMSDEDLGAVIAYVKSVPPVDRDAKPMKVGLLGTIVMGSMYHLPAGQIDHEAPRPVAPEAGVTVEYGKYLVSIAACQSCHGKKLDGKSDDPFGAPNLIKVGNNWTEEQFVNTIRQGIDPKGHKLNRDYMPWDYYTRMTDDELSAIWLYLESLE